ncbi:hypothetical protein M1139_01305 [Candidatus Parvarchaeota archaeon]|jgi:hypothetical protein|nr:hypothetical protein [Candidatus Parvarchaeota archaeon]
MGKRLDKIKSGLGYVKRPLSKVVGTSKMPSSEIPAAKTPEDLYYKMQIEEMKKAAKKKNKIIQNVSKRSLKIAIPIIIVILVVFFLAYGYIVTSPTVSTANTYLLLHFPVLGTVWHLIASIPASISSGISFISNPLASTTPPSQVVNVTSTFTSFLGLSAPTGQTLTLTGASETQSFSYFVTNNANVPVGSSTSNNVLENISCGGTSTQATSVCDALLSNFNTPPATSQSSPPIVTDFPLTTNELPTQSLSYSFTATFKCPSSSIKFPTYGSFLLGLTTFNYTAGSILPLEYASQSVAAQLTSASHPLIPSLPSVVFVTAGPIQLKLSTNLPEPILTKADQVPINVQINNIGTGSYSLNAVSLFISTNLSNSNPDELTANSMWSCSVSSGLTRQNFVFPSGYWNCTISPRFLSSGSSFLFTLPAMQTLNGLHFNTIPVLGYVNYNYASKLSLPFVVQNETTACG